MKKVVYYHYLGTNGTILSPVHLEDAYYVRKYHLIADPGKKVTKDGQHLYQEITIPEEELEEWSEVENAL